MDYIKYIDDFDDDDFDDDDFDDDDIDVGTREVTVEGIDDDLHCTVGYGWAILDAAVDLAKKVGAIYGSSSLVISCVISGKELIEFIQANEIRCWHAHELLGKIDENHKYELTAWDV